MAEHSMETLIVVNPRARLGDLGSRWSGLERELLEVLGVESAQVVFTSPADFGSEMTRNGLRKGIRRIVVVGGDGTVSQVVQGFFDQGRPIAPDAVLVVMPGGRGDDFFKSLAGGRSQYSSKDAWQSGLKLLKSGSPQPCDVGTMEFLTTEGASSPKRFFINIASFGYPGLVVKRVQSDAGLLGKSIVGKSAWAYLMQAAGGLIEYKPIPMLVKVDGEVLFQGPIFSGFVLNGRFNAGGACWAEAAKIDDGLFHVLVTEPRGPVKFLASLGRMRSGNWDGVEKVHLRAGKTVEVTASGFDSTRHPLFEIDGDQPEPNGTYGARFEILPQAIRVWR